MPKQTLRFKRIAAFIKNSINRYEMIIFHTVTIIPVQIIIPTIATLTIITSFEFTNSVLIDIHIYSILVNSRILFIILSKSFL